MTNENASSHILRLLLAFVQFNSNTTRAYWCLLCQTLGTKVKEQSSWSALQTFVMVLLPVPTWWAYIVCLVLSNSASICCKRQKLSSNGRKQEADGIGNFKTWVCFRHSWIQNLKCWYQGCVPLSSSLYCTFLFISPASGWSLLPGARWTPAAPSLHLQLSGTVMEIANPSFCLLQQMSTNWLWLDRLQLWDCPSTHHFGPGYRKFWLIGLGQFPSLESRRLNLPTETTHIKVISLRGGKKTGMM